ncbi:MAG: hypothetical protein HGB34_01170 [Candidatus Moranbacteria bacterium]|nr:hypothetical protein [Candidatus Moranbacteria bacterium]NTW75491.1 hypothetical protein [Candidatus Moranbacteria bacterium]
MVSDTNNSLEKSKKGLSDGVARAFFDIRSEDSAVTSSIKVAAAAVKRTVYVVADYWLAILSAWIVGVMKYFEFGFWSIAAAIFAYDLIVAFSFLYLNEKTKQDVTLAEGFRRAVDALHKRSRIAGLSMFLLVIGRATIWDGPEQVVIYFRKELQTMFRMSALLVAITSFQSLFWTWVYGLGYDSVAGMISSLFSGR